MMEDVPVRIELDTDRRVNSLPHLVPGDHAEGSVAITPRSDLRDPTLEVRVRWDTEGRGESDGEVVIELVFSPGPMEAHQLVLLPFSFRVPSGPWSYEGALVRIVWKVEATVLGAGTRHDAGLPVVVAPEARADVAGPW